MPNQGEGEIWRQYLISEEKCKDNQINGNQITVQYHLSMLLISELNLVDLIPLLTSKWSFRAFPLLPFYSPTPIIVGF